MSILLAGTTITLAQEAEETTDAAAASDASAGGGGGGVDIAAGATIFANNCGSCHARDMKTNLTGPALGGVEGRWDNEADLYAWIRNSQGLIAAGHPRAVELWNAWKPTVMQPFPNLTDQDIANLLAFIQEQYQPTTAAGGPSSTTTTVEKGNNNFLFIVLLVILGILAVVLARIISNLNYMNQVKEGTAPARRRTLVDILTSRGVISFVIFALVVLGGYTTVNNAIELGRQQGYQPQQPIEFYHTIHAGQDEIDCQYCHDGARRSKHAVIPATNTCMNCHRAIKVGTRWGTAELTKIFASIGFNPNTDTYFSKDTVTEEQMEKIYKKWISDQHVQAGGSTNEIERVANDQWAGIVKALSTETDPDIQGPIEWVRIHNLPDHVYFNHSQHVTVGKIECQTCHGPVEQMEVVAQYSPLSMGWCVNCHRQTNVQFMDNEYYEAYEKYHQEIKNGTRDNVTVEEIGGLGCQKCHY